MNSLQIRYFLHLCGTKSISETARQLFVAQPAVSKQISALERELEFPLFVRTNRGVSLTEGGRALYPFLVKCSDEFDLLCAEARKRQTQAQNQLTVGILESLGLDELQGVVAGLQSGSPDLNITLLRLDNPTLLQRLSEGRLDVAITFDHALEHRAGVGYTELVLEQSLFVISAAHPLAQRDVIFPRDLSGELVCETLPRDGSGSDRYLRHLLELLDIHPRGFVSVDNLASGLAAVETNFAVGLIDERIQLVHPERYRLIPTGTYQSVVCAALETNRNPYARRLTQSLREAFSPA